MQKKDVIYIDVEDDITAIIGKVKDAKEKIVALVPPKRTGVLQSAVNLRLLARTADNEKKRLVLITGNAALAGLAASAKIPVAKNLQSAPKLADAPTAGGDDDEDVIDGEQLPVGDHASMPDEDEEEIIIPEDLDNIDVDSDAASKSDGSAKKADKSGSKKRIKVPDFGTFRKKMVFGIGGGVLVLLFLVWAIWIAPHATIVVSAKTSDQALSVPVTLGPNLTTDSEAAKIKVITQTDKETQSVDFVATGKKNVGDKATGTVKFTKSDPGSATVPSGTQLTTSGGLVFVTTATIVIPGATVDFTPPYLHPGSGTVNVQAAEGGANYNGATGAVSGSPAGMSAGLTSATSGGTDKMATVVTQQDIDGAKDQLKDQNSDDIKRKLKAKFDNDSVVIDFSFTSSGGDPQSSPAVGQETASGSAKLTSEVTYTMMAVPKSEMGSYLDAAFKKTLTNSERQRVYDNGLGTVKFDDYKLDDKAGTATATLTATAQIGPKINDDDVKDQAKGRRSGEVISNIKAIDGVSDVDVKLSPFWVSGVPDDTKKITVEFKLITNG